MSQGIWFVMEPGRLVPPRKDTSRATLFLSTPPIPLSPVAGAFIGLEAPATYYASPVIRRELQKEDRGGIRTPSAGFSVATRVATEIDDDTTPA